ncbi:MAG TPA: DUF2934 domain-containing protein [Casimicrobiaceae bacterium]|nr:DUF2934 domain-containing protein [Casimicrobiaceae bacterium]
MAQVMSSKDKRRTATPQRDEVDLPTTQSPTGSVDQPFVDGSAEDAIDGELRHRLISEAAYRLYAERGYADGYDVDDWLQAEAAVDHLLLNANSPVV